MNSILDSDEEIAATEVKGSGSSIISLVPPPEATNETAADSTTDAQSASVKDEVRSDSAAEGMRQHGLAYSAGIAFFASVVFMLVIGWGADLLFGSTPWGIVVGIVLGSVIGFVQFFRINSQIFKPNKASNSSRLLITDDDDDK